MVQLALELGRPEEPWGREEILGSAGGHACYPTALRALCGAVRPAAALSGVAPSCVSCAAVAPLVGAVDGSCPEGWLLPVEAAA